MTLYRLFALLHLAAGTAALLAFWVAALSRKGSAPHRAAGRWHLRAMTTVLISAMPLAAVILTQRSIVLGMFLLYLFVLVGTSVFCGWRALRDKNDWHRYTGRIYRLLLGLNACSGLAAIALGAFFMPTLRAVTVIIGLLGLATALRMFLFLRRPPQSPRWWLGEHFTSMVQSGAGAHVAFLFFGLPKVLPALAGPGMQNLAWLTPIVLAGIAQPLLARTYLRRPARLRGTIAVHQ